MGFTTIIGSFSIGFLIALFLGASFSTALITGIPFCVFFVVFIKEFDNNIFKSIEKEIDEFEKRTFNSRREKDLEKNKLKRELIKKRLLIFDNPELKKIARDIINSF